MNGPALPHPAPLVVGGTGGSGTRVIARVLMRSGRYMGANRNDEEDALEFQNFDYRWTPRYLAARAKGDELPEADRQAMEAEFAAARERHRAPIDDPAAPWGWKHPPSVHLLPFLDHVYPGLRFIHMIRDGRDTAFRRTGVHVHASLLADAVLGDDPGLVAERARTGKPTKVSPVVKALFWGRVNLECADFGESRLGNRYLRVRLEDLFANPDSVLEEVLTFSQADGTAPAEVRDEVSTPSGFGEWRQQNQDELRLVVEAAAPALERFGYIS